MFINCNGIVINEILLKENNKLLTILTDSYGKLTVTGFRAKSTKSELMASCQLFSYSSFVLELKNDRYKIHSSELISSFYNLRNDIKTLSLAGYLGQLCEHFAQFGQDCSELLRLLLNTYHILTLKTKPFDIIKAVFELKLAKLSGFEPNISYCNNCTSNEVAFFSENRVEIVCKNCKNTYERYLPLSASALKGISYILNSDLKKAFSFTAGADTLRTISIFCEQYILSISDRSFKALKFYKTLT
ncbi:MAG: DNA repair protein RecO [Clostridia bacterium]